MVYSFARVSATVAMRVEDYFQHGKRAWLRLHEKGGKGHEVPCHHNLRSTSTRGCKLPASSATSRRRCSDRSAKAVS
jgi:integrase/recombinase XerC